MKKVIVTSILALSFITASATQLLESEIVNDTINNKESKNTTEVVYPTLIVEEAADEPFEFNTKDYLPVGFNPTLSLDENYNLEFSSIVEEDEAFDFNTNDYLPVGFNLSQALLDSIVEIETEYEDEPFEFDTKKYLPKGFNPLKKETIINEL
ncbi:MAG: hypothetical protein HKN90_03355 [Flavobacteriaceae bacterium]|nr:hypothetical protein [Flavobacteriaceae bacterium]